MPKVTLTTTFCIKFVSCTIKKMASGMWKRAKSLINAVQSSMFYITHLLPGVLFPPKRNKTDTNLVHENKSSYTSHPEKDRTWCDVIQYNNSAKIQIMNFKKKLDILLTFWNWLIRSVNMKWIRLVLLKIQKEHDLVCRPVDGRHDGQTGGQSETSVTTHTHLDSFFVGYNNYNSLVDNWDRNL